MIDNTYCRTFHIAGRLHPKMKDLSRLSYPGYIVTPLSKARWRLAGMKGNTNAVLATYKCSNKLIKQRLQSSNPSCCPITPIVPI